MADTRITDEQFRAYLQAAPRKHWPHAIRMMERIAAGDPPAEVALEFKLATGGGAKIAQEAAARALRGGKG